MDTTAPSALEHLRAEIDRIDQEVLDLLVARSAVVRRIGEVKGDRLDGRPALRPAREAQILRRLAARADGRFPTAVLVRMWRELIAAQTRLQAPLSVAVFARDEGIPQVWDLARDHFGSTTPMVRVDRATQALRALNEGTATVAVLPLPNDDESWWVSLMSDQDRKLRAFARLPFVSSHGEETRALAIGQLEIEPSGDDLALLAIEAEPGLSRGGLRELLVAADPRTGAAFNRGRRLCPRRRRPGFGPAEGGRGRGLARRAGRRLRSPAEPGLGSSGSNRRSRHRAGSSR